jgi:hypothetical protein
VRKSERMAKKKNIIDWSEVVRVWSHKNIGTANYEKITKTNVEKIKWKTRFEKQLD